MTSPSEGTASAEELARRSGERRQSDAVAAAETTAAERRQADRRQRKPGLGALVKALLGKP